MLINGNQFWGAEDYGRLFKCFFYFAELFRFSKVCMLYLDLSVGYQLTSYSTIFDYILKIQYRLLTALLSLIFINVNVFDIYLQKYQDNFLIETVLGVSACEIFTH